MDEVIACDVTLDPAFTVAPVPPRLFGSFIEHMGRCVYGGVVDPGHPSADADGLRRDVLELTRELGVRVVRYPGGNFVSGYAWEDGVGPVEARPTRLDLAWRSIEPNTFGLDEFAGWAAKAEVEPMLAVNLGTRGVADAVNLLEYTNLAPGTRYADLRVAHGRREPYGVKLWCLGNEMDGPWQIGHKSADEYGRLAAQTAAAMRMVDPTIELVACGSSHERMPTFGAWEAAVLEHAYDDVDYVSLHAYYEKVAGDRIGYLASADAMDAFIAGVVATCDHVGAKRRSRRRLRLSFDEWNLEPRAGGEDHPWQFAPRISEDEYNVEDAVVVGGLLMCLLRNADRVAVACLAQLVNVIAPIRTEPDGEAWRQTIFFPFALTARHARGDVLRVEPRCAEVVASPTRGDVAPADVVATRDPDDGAVAIFATNRSTSRPVLLRAALVGREGYRVAEHTVVGGGEWDLTNGPAARTRYAPQVSDRHLLREGELSVELPPASWTMVRLERVEPA
jgi:alpha-N-arabinofuranosidase